MNVGKGDQRNLESEFVIFKIDFTGHLFSNGSGGSMYGRGREGRGRERVWIKILENIIWTEIKVAMWRLIRLEFTVI